MPLAFALKNLFVREKFVARTPLELAVVAAMKDVQALARSHGGRIEVLGVSTEGVVTVRLQGTCRFCPLSTLTLRVGVEKKLLDTVPGITKVKVSS